MVLTKTEAEARRTCEAGLANYLSNRHSVHINRSLAYGVIGGIVPTSALFLISAFYPVNRWYSLIPLVGGIAAGMGYGVITADSNDEANSADFDTVCSAFEEQEQEESDGATDQPDAE
jgi:hypothetical protein